MTRFPVSQTDPPEVIRDRYLAPSVLSPFADDLAERLARLSVGPVLETMADVGVLTQAIASAMSAGLTIIATDPRAATLALAAEKPGTARVTWQTADPCALPFDSGTFGVVACQFGMAAMAERVLAFREARRVIKPAGRFIFNVPASLRVNPVAECVQQALAGLFAPDPPNYLAAVLHGYADNEVVDDDLTAAGFTDAVYTSVELTYAAHSAADCAIGYCLGTPLRDEIEARGADRMDDALQAAVAALTQQFGGGAIVSTMRAHVVSAAG